MNQQKERQKMEIQGSVKKEPEWNITVQEWELSGSREAKERRGELKQEQDAEREAVKETEREVVKETEGEAEKETEKETETESESKSANDSGNDLQDHEAKQANEKRKDRIKRKLQGVKQWFCLAADRWGQDYKRTEGIVFYSAMLWCGVWAAWQVWEAWKLPAAALAAGVLVFGGLWLLGFLLRQVWKLAKRLGIRWIYARALVWGCLVTAGLSGVGKGDWQDLLYLLMLPAALLVGIFLKSAAALLHGQKTRRTAPVCLVSGTFVILLVFFLDSGGIKDARIPYLVSLWEDWDQERGESAGMGGEETERFLQDMQIGSYTVKTVDYGIEKEPLVSKTTDISAFAGQQGIEGYLKEWYQGYGLNAVPIRGRIWYPEERKQCETIFLAHGNHVYSEESYLGYGYLGEYLASHGYLVVSVDENACNLLSGENDARAVLLLENMKQIMRYSRDPKNLLYQRINEDQLALAGHSRGGEMIAAAYLFNNSSRYPDNGSITFSYDFSIRSLFAIAPSVNQYRPSGRDVELAGVNYYVLYGGSDQDVTNFMGMYQYYNTDVSGEAKLLKGALLAEGLNHGQFNERWGAYDLGGPQSLSLQTKDFLPEADQQQIARVFAKVFFDVTLRGDDTYRTLLTDVENYRKVLPKTVYAQVFQASGFQSLCDFEEDAELSTGTMEGSSIAVHNVASYQEKLWTMLGGVSTGNHILSFRWSGKETGDPEALAEVYLPEDWSGRIGEKEGLSHPKELERQKEQEEENERREEKKGEKREKKEESKQRWENAVLTFDVMDQTEYKEKAEARMLPGTVIVRDRNGAEASVSLEDYAAVYPSLPLYKNKFLRLLSLGEHRHTMQTVRIPFRVLMEANPEWNPEELWRIQIAFPQKDGYVALDQIGISWES